jgi:hypothetical protein
MAGRIEIVMIAGTAKIDNFCGPVPQLDTRIGLSSVIDNAKMAILFSQAQSRYSF